MKIIERYPTGYRLFRGRGGWLLLAPLRFMLAGAYRCYLAAAYRGSFGGSSRTGRQGGGGGKARVVSIGNIEVGGGGKTPFAIALAERMIRTGKAAAVVTRGYRSRAERVGKPVVVPAGCELRCGEGAGFLTEDELVGRMFAAPHRVTPLELSMALGDEVLLYRRRGIPVVIDRSRRLGIEIARDCLGADVVLLDDAFQRREIPRDLDIVLLDARSPFGAGSLIPLGTLREPPDALHRADAIVFTRAVEHAAPPEASSWIAGRSVFFAEHKPDGFLGRDGESLPLSALGGEPVALFSGIARPESFERLVRSIGIRPERSFRFVDHHEYTDRDVESMLEEAAEGATFLTTEKDWAKSAELFPPQIPVLALRIEMEISGVEDLLDLMG